MKTINVRELKDRPGALFQEMEKGEIVVLAKGSTIGGVAIPIKRVIEVGAQKALAISLFEKGLLSLGQASKLAGMSKGDFIRLLAKFELSPISLTHEELREELKLADELL